MVKFHQYFINQQQYYWKKHFLIFQNLIHQKIIIHLVNKTLIFYQIQDTLTSTKRQYKIISPNHPKQDLIQSVINETK